MKINKIGVSLAILYVVIAFVIALQDFNCGGGLDINICGLGTVFVTFPSYLTVGWVFSKIGLAINFRHRSPSASDLVLLSAHIIICAIFLYLVVLGLQRAIARLQSDRRSR